ncbi:doubled CXXCH motif [bacterium BMS3Bbin11]|nr:doubled CXXCH motif [bacterium BMS3Bbin11]
MNVSLSVRFIFACMLLSLSFTTRAALESNISLTKHNLSVSGQGDIIATSEDEICVFCHTPHGATTEPGAPLWNKALSGQSYTTYMSSSIDAELVGNQLAQPAGSSKLCLSCHDGTLAIGAVNVKAGQQNVLIDLAGIDPGGKMPAAGSLTGFTRNLSTDLSNDHPISVTYDDTLSNKDGELRVPDAQQRIPPGSGDDVAIRNHAAGVIPLLPLESTGPNGKGQVQCATCHDPHVRDTDATINNKFLRANRFQNAAPVAGNIFNENLDTICLACHDKDLGSAGWAQSAHANNLVANEQYKALAAGERDFPSDISVWEAACLNCHDTHTVSGARRLAREGTDDTNTPKQGGNSAIEETCYQCHTNSAETILSSTTNVPNIKDIFNLVRHMPITTSDQQATTEVHDIGTGSDGFEGTKRGINFVEDQNLLGKGAGNKINRHAECTDCHNPHRVIKNFLFNANAGAPDSAGTHRPGGVNGNIASGVLRGIWGVEPNYSGSSFFDLPSSYTIKQGVGSSTSVNAAHLTREYQLCFKCHSDYGYDDNNVYPTGNRPNLDDSGGSTPQGTNNLDQYTNQAREFQAPTGDKGESGGNHRSWHPVVDDTGRALGDRSIDAADNPWRPPFDAAVGTQTMHCSDCHGPDTANDTIDPNGGEDGEPWGPHGSQNDFILKGTWDGLTGGNSSDVPATDPNNGICFKCHEFQAYADRNGDNSYDSGFSGTSGGMGGGTSNNLHARHAARIGKMHCNWCHVAVPHGWKNKAFLVNLNDVGAEAGQAGIEVPIGSSAQTYDVGPYYNNAKLKIRTFRTSGNWSANSCGSSSGGGFNTGTRWMRRVCSNPP